jgi:hypothetical protein
MCFQTVHAKEQEIEKRKVQVREKVQAQLNRVENEARSLDQLRKVSSHCPHNRLALSIE